MPRAGLLTVVLFPAIAALTPVKAQTDVKKAACFWGNAKALIETAAEVCPHLGVGQVAADTIAAVEAIDTFEPCYREGVVRVARDKPATDTDKALFCAQASTAPGFGGSTPFLQRK